MGLCCTAKKTSPNYRVTCSARHCDELGSYQTYDIIALDQENRTVAEILDVTVSSLEAAELVRRLNDGEVALEHFRDVVLDYIASFE